MRQSDRTDQRECSTDRQLSMALTIVSCYFEVSDVTNRQTVMCVRLANSGIGHALRSKNVGRQTIAIAALVCYCQIIVNIIHWTNKICSPVKNERTSAINDKWASVHSWNHSDTQQKRNTDNFYRRTSKSQLWELYNKKQRHHICDGGEGRERKS